MLFELCDRLEPLGRLDILEPAAKQALEYFDQRAGADETPEAAGKRSAALAYEKALAIAERLAAQDPTTSGWQRDLSGSYEKIGDVRRDEGDRKASLAAYEKSLAIRERLAAQDPGNAGWQSGAVLSYIKIGDVRLAEGDRKGALETYEKALAIAERLADNDPKNVELQRYLALSHSKIGDVRWAEGDRKAARDAFRNAAAVWERLGKQDPGNPTYVASLYWTHAFISAAEGRYGEATETIENGISVLEKLEKGTVENRTNTGMKTAVATAYGHLAIFGLLDRKPREAITAASRGIELGPEQTWIKTILAHGYLFTGEYDKG